MRWKPAASATFLCCAVVVLAQLLLLHGYIIWPWGPLIAVLLSFILVLLHFLLVPVEVVPPQEER